MAGFVLLAALMAVSCSVPGENAPETGEREESDNPDSEGNPGGENADGDPGGGESTGEKRPEEKKPKKPPKPYAAIEPAADAVPLTETIEVPEEKESPGGGTTTAGPSGTTNAEQYGQYEDQYGQYGAQYGQYEPVVEERSVPVGQVLGKGKKDESDGPLKNNRLVAYYGFPDNELMGELGEYEPEEMMERLKEQTAEYSNLDPERPAVPTIELITSVAQREPQADGSYIARMFPEQIEEYAKLAEENDALLMLDVQLGRSTVMEEFDNLRPFLERPYVHLAIDTEYSVEEGQVPGENLGQVDGSEIQEAVEELDRMVEKEGIPDKLLMVHQFEEIIVPNKGAIKPTDDVQVVLHADGFGGPAAKISKYNLLVRDQPIQYGGFKLFLPKPDPTAIGQDTPLMTPEEVLALDPTPALVTYQ